MSSDRSSWANASNPRMLTDSRRSLMMMSERMSSIPQYSAAFESVCGGGHRTAILLLDFQNEFVKKGGKLHAGVSDLIEVNNVLEKVPKLVDLARKLNAMIIYSPVVMKETGRFNNIFVEEPLPAEGKESFQAEKYTEMHGLFTENTWNCEIAHEVEPRTSDIILRDRSDFSAFAGTELLSHLQSNNVTHLFVTGFLTDMCVYQTAMDAANLLDDARTYVISDCCAAKSMENHSDALDRLRSSSSSVRVVTASEAESMLVDCDAAAASKINSGNVEEWLMIDKIFSVGGVVDREGTMDGEKLLSLIGSTVEPDSAILSTLSESIHKKRGWESSPPRGGDHESNNNSKGQVSREDMHRILFQRKPRTTFLEKLPIFLTMIYMPFLYSISTRIPFIFVALEITNGRGRELWEVGLVLGVYQTSRALGNLIIVTFGGKNPFKRLQLLLIFSALFGWLFLTLYERPSSVTGIFDFEPYFEDGDGIIWPLFALFFVGLCETIVILQRAIMIETAKESPSGIIDEVVLANRFSLQYALVSFGAVVAFIVGGWLYTNRGFYSVCDFGILIQIAHLLGAILYMALDKNSKKSPRSVDDLDGNDLIRSVIYRFQALSEISRYSQGVANGSESAFGPGSSGLSDAAIKAKSDRVLNHSLGELYRHFFNSKSGSDDDLACFEKLLEASISNRAKSAFLESKRPHAMAVGKTKLSKLVLFLMKSTGGGNDQKLTEGEFISFWAPRIYLSMFESSHESAVTVVWPYMRAVVATQAIAALCIGIFLSTALLSYTQRFDIEAAQVGLLLGIGEALGSVVIFLKTFVSNFGAYKTNRNLIGKSIISRPLNVPSIIIFAGICSMLFAVNNFVFAVVCQMMYSSVNDLSVSLMNELVGTSLPPNNFKRYQGMGQWLRRLGNMITAILGPILFGVSEGLPFLIFGAIVIVWALFLWSLMHAHAARISASAAIDGEDDEGEKGKEYNQCLTESGLVEPFLPFLETSRTPWHVLEQRYYAKNRDRIDEKLNSLKKTSVDISLMEHRIRSLAAALEVEKHQRRALEDRMYARPVSTDPFENDPFENESKTIV